MAKLLIAPRTTPHLWTVYDGVVVTVGGNLSRDELLHVTPDAADARMSQRRIASPSVAEPRLGDPDAFATTLATVQELMHTSY